MSGIAPTTALPEDARTTLCRHCATLIRYWPARELGELDREVDPELDRRGDPGGTWRHVIVGFDHAPEPMTDRAGVPELTESEKRLMDGNR